MKLQPLAPISRVDLDSGGPCCRKCRFFRQQEVPEQANLVVTLCKRYPPVLTMLAIPVMPPNGIIPKQGQPMPMTFVNQNVFPIVAESDWCGEYLPLPQ